MPGLLRGMARTAVVAGTATAVSNRVSRRQARRWGYEDPYAQPQQAYEPAPAAAPAAVEEGPDPVAQLRELAKLRDDGILTDEEFAAEKRKILG
ncbi:MAG TPA: SHOCT domain-containing protein [Solirubrobacteraceae bacterium]|jgi:hypothetical protein|nr:SHOCT domain-containing protein [Solirubrobacteraceae bacterium]